MQPPFPFEPFLEFGFLSIMLIVGIILRAKVPILQRFLFPSCLIGGFLGLIVSSTGLVDFDITHFETFAFHFFVISFISVGLTPSAKKKKEPGGTKKMLRGALWMALVEGVTLPMQAVVGGLLVILFGFIGVELFPTFGFMVPLGFTEGPGQALSFGKVWEGFGFAHAATIGLTFAAIGFFFAFFVGVPLVNWGLRKGLATEGNQALSEDFLKGVVPKDLEKEKAGELTLHSGNVDTIAFQAALIGLVYVLGYGLAILLMKVLPQDVGKMLWGFFFFVGLLVALIVRWVMAKIGVDHLIDPGVQKRLTGWAIDFLIVSTVVAIQLVVVRQFILPITVISVTGGVLTTIVVVYLGRRLDTYNLERTAVIYGTCTGTVSSGLLLLRIVDPDFKTPVALEVGIMNILVAPIILGCTLLLSAPVLWGWSLGLTILIFAAVFLACLVALRVLKYWGSPKF
jgi:ESS family glutamate:Na+ symporter